MLALEVVDATEPGGLAAELGQSCLGLRGIFHLLVASDLCGTKQMTGREKGPL